jgi:hypothetical protein
MRLTLSELAGLGTMTPGMADLFEAMVAARLNIVVSGGMDTGKTMMVRALCSAIGPHERIITVEDSYELGLDSDPRHSDVVPMQPRDNNIEGAGGIDMVQLVRWATRMNPSRVIVGEVRGAEVIPLLNALNQGTDGSMTTIHASSTREAFKKIPGYARQSREQLPFDVTYQLRRQPQRELPTEAHQQCAEDQHAGNGDDDLLGEVLGGIPVKDREVFEGAISGNPRRRSGAARATSRRRRPSTGPTGGRGSSYSSSSRCYVSGGFDVLIALWKETSGIREPSRRPRPSGTANPCGASRDGAMVGMFNSKTTTSGHSLKFSYGWPS